MTNKDCLRCGQEAKVSAIGEALKNFVCDICRLDTATWDFQAIHLNTMEFESPEPHSVFLERMEKVNAYSQYR